MAGSDAVFRELLPEWRSLWLSAADREPFSHPGWVQAYLAAFEPDAECVLLSVRLNGELAAVFPLIRESTVLDGMPVRLLRALMNPHAFRVHVLASGRVLQTPCAICDTLATTRGWDLLTIPRCASDGFAFQIGCCTRSHGFPTLLQAEYATRHLVMPGPEAVGGEGGWLAEVDPDLQKKMRRASKQIQQTFGTEPQLEIADAADPAHLSRFYDIEASGWKGREGTAIKCASTTRQFYDQAAQAFAAERALRLQFLRAGDVTLAGAFSVAAGDRLFVLKWSYDESYSKYRPGQLLAREIFRHASQNGTRVVDLGPDAEYKREWTPHTRPHEALYVFNHTIYGRLLYLYRARLRPRVGRLIRNARHRTA